MAKGSFRLRKWKTNSARARQYIWNCETDGFVVGEEIASDMPSEKVTLTEDDTSYANVSVTVIRCSDKECEPKVPCLL